MTAVILLAIPTGAHAGTYSVTSCNVGWTAEVQRAPGEDAPNAYNYCNLAEHGFMASFSSVYGARLAVGDYAGWRFDAPADTNLVSAVVQWSGHGDYAASDWGAVQARIDASTTPGVGHYDAFDTVDRLDIADASWLRISLACTRYAAAQPCRSQFDPAPLSGSPLFFVKRASVALLDRYPPVVQTVGGPAVENPVWSDSLPLTFTASDRGGGVYRVLVSVDGRVLAALPIVLDDRCIDRTGSREFSYPVPCPTQAAGTVYIEPATLPSGQHRVAVDLEDAAGNRAPLLAPTQRLIINDYRTVGYYAAGHFFNPRFATPRVANGDGAIDGARLTAGFPRRVGKRPSRRTANQSTREVRFAQQATMRGSLTTPSGEPIRRATVFIGQKTEGQEWRLGGAVRTNSRGQFVYRTVARQPSRQLRAVYFPFSDSHENATSGRLYLGVRAGMTLHVNRHRLRNGERLVFSGRVLGQLPNGGIAVALQAKVGRHYRSFRQLRASNRTRGRIRTVYRFERTTRPVRYRFRLKVVRQAGLPYRSGVSPVVSVTVRP